MRFFYGALQLSVPQYYVVDADIVITLSQCVYVGMYDCMCVGVYVSTIKWKNPDQYDLKLGTVLVLDSLLKPVDLGFRRSRVKGTGSGVHIFG